jgi:CpeS-like protein
MLFCNFLEINSGTWVTQRTTYFFQNNMTNVQKSKVLIKRSKDKKTIRNEQGGYSSSISDILHQHITYSLQPTSFYEQNIENIIKVMGQISTSILVYMNKLNYISVRSSIGNLNSSEKIWLINPNLRISFSIIKKANICVAISFSSDIRIK